MELVSIDLYDQAGVPPVTVDFIAADPDVRFGSRQARGLDEGQQPLFAFRARKGCSGWICNERAQGARSFAGGVSLQQHRKLVADVRVAMLSFRQSAAQLGCGQRPDVEQSACRRRDRQPLVLVISSSARFL